MDANMPWVVIAPVLVGARAPSSTQGPSTTMSHQFIINSHVVSAPSPVLVGARPLLHGLAVIPRPASITQAQAGVVVTRAHTVAVGAALLVPTGGRPPVNWLGSNKSSEQQVLSKRGQRGPLLLLITR